MSVNLAPTLPADPLTLAPAHHAAAVRTGERFGALLVFGEVHDEGDLLAHVATMHAWMARYAMATANPSPMAACMYHGTGVM